MSIGERDEHPAGELGKGGFGHVAADAAAGGMPTRAPDPAIDLDGHLGRRPGKVGAVGGRPMRSEAFLHLKRCPCVPHRQAVLALEGKAWEGDQPLIGKSLLQVAAARHGQR